MGDAATLAIGARAAQVANLLGGRVEVDETCIGGIEPGLAGGRAKGTKALVGIAVERVGPKG